MIAGVGWRVKGSADGEEGRQGGGREERPERRDGGLARPASPNGAQGASVGVPVPVVRWLDAGTEGAARPRRERAVPGSAGVLACRRPGGAASSAQFARR
jgi:hypothetical protein